MQKTVYLHSNGQLVIWGNSQYFESSELVMKDWSFNSELVDDDQFREIVDIFNNNVIKFQKTLKEKDDYIINRFCL